MKPCKKCGSTDKYRGGDCKKCTLLRAQKSRASAPDSVSAKKRTATSPQTPEQKKRYHNNWRANRPHVYLAKKARYRARKRNACPEWLTKEQHQQIADIYARSVELSAGTGIAHEVDHIVPLAGVEICGLHVPWNLQVITAEENRKKGTQTNRKTGRDPV